MPGRTFTNLIAAAFRDARRGADLRPALVGDDVENLEAAGLSAANSGREPLIRLQQVKGALLQNCRPQADTFVAIDGERSGDIALLSNDLRRVRTPIVKADNFTGEVLQVGNLESKPPAP